MKVKQHHQIALLLTISAFLLASLIPGGPIENRVFSHIHPGILSGFNIFLTLLNLGTFALIYFVIRKRSWTYAVTFLAALSYFIVYAIDLAQLFPRSPTPMSQALALIEVLGMCAAVPLMYLSWPHTFFARHDKAGNDAIEVDDVSSATHTLNPVLRTVMIALVLVLGVGIVFFATDSAMNSAHSTEFFSQ